MGRLKIQPAPPAPKRAAENDFGYRTKHDRTAFDYIIIGFAYIFAPLGFVLALIRFVSTHYRNERKSINFDLLFHVLIGAFMELVVLFAVGAYKGDFTWKILLIILVVLYVIFVLPAKSFSGRSALAKGRFKFLCDKYLMLVTVQEVRHIGNISDIVKESETDVRRDLDYLTEWGLLTRDIVYYEGRIANPLGTQPLNLVHPGRTQVSAAQRSGKSAGQQPSSPASPQLPKSIACPGCGAPNTVSPGASKICDYCGTTISYS
ncbi:hypothetical protein J7E73_15375 [Paenibacillus albidus]|uniref:hypothetical protein n=1 Tax=Paenibacillus albidus TaxID=2041023 RepID=UPI001BE9B88A|nr:hypothetical protein [Paenibacillus albidus]MBT2290487.1 hypothetical protein [Paenibacillus albidus]